MADSENINLNVYETVYEIGHPLFMVFGLEKDNSGKKHMFVDINVPGVVMAVAVGTYAAYIYSQITKKTNTKNK